MYWHPPLPELHHNRISITPICKQNRTFGLVTAARYDLKRDLHYSEWLQLYVHLGS